MIINLFEKAKETNKKLVAVLIDPAALNDYLLSKYISAFKQSPPDFIFIGGSLLWNDIGKTIEYLKNELDIPVIIFPGYVNQISDKADAILFISLISGRNPEFLIGQQVVAAPIIKNTQLEIIPTGYILVENGKTTSVEYMSNTKPIPADKKDIIKATALAGQYLGHKLMYIEAGSGAKNSINNEIIKELSEYIDLPIIVGGGISSPEQAKSYFDNGAACVVIGSLFEKHPDKISSFISSVREK